MKFILGMILSSMITTAALAQSSVASDHAVPVAQGNEPQQALPEHPPTPGSMENSKDPMADKQNAGAITRKHNHKKMKKSEEQNSDSKSEKKAVPVKPAPGQSVD